MAIAFGELGRTEELLPALREQERTTKTRIRDFLIAARALLEKNFTESIAAVNRIVASDFQDPEGL